MLGLGSGLILVVFPRSRFCYLHGNDSRLLFELASTVTNGNDHLRKGKLAWKTGRPLCVTYSDFKSSFFISIFVAGIV